MVWCVLATAAPASFFFLDTAFRLHFAIVTDRRGNVPPFTHAYLSAWPRQRDEIYRRKIFPQATGLELKIVRSGDLRVTEQQRYQFPQRRLCDVTLFRTLLMGRHLWATRTMGRSQTRIAYRSEFQEFSVCGERTVR